MPFRPYIIILILLLLGLTPGQAYAQHSAVLSTSVLYGIEQYRAEIDGKEVQDARTQRGQLSVRYSRSGTIGDARLGSYTLMLGYEFAIMNSSVLMEEGREPVSERVKAGKLLYQGALVLAPGGLPFRLTAYARDIEGPSSYASTTLPGSPLGNQPNSNGKLVEPNITTNLGTGLHREVAATMFVGIRNGSYLGAYRDVLSQLPRLLIDYRQTDINEDSGNINPTHTRSRDLAFISLNKKDNWLHFRTRDFIDYLNSTNDTTMSQVMIGTVDHTLSRQWINLTNWIKISSDFSYTAEKTRIDPGVTKSYLLNFFVQTSSQKAQSNVFSNFERTTRGGVLTRNASLPIYISFQPNRDTLYHGAFRSDFSRESKQESVDSTTRLSNHDSVYFNLGADLFRTHDVFFSPDLQLNAYSDNDTRGISEKLTLDIANQRNSNNLMWSVGVTLAATQTTKDASQSQYLEKGFYTALEKKLGKTLRSGLKLSVLAGDGTILGNDGSIVTENITINTSTTQIDRSTISSFQQYNANLFLENNDAGNENRLSFNFQEVKDDIEDITSLQVEHLLRQRHQKTEFILKSSLLFGDNVTLLTNDLDYVAVNSDLVDADFSWASEATYKYLPDRRMSLSLIGTASGTEGGKSNNLSWRCAEKLDYRFFTVNGIVRELAKITEEIGWEKADEGILGRDDAFFVRLLGSYNPTRFFYVKLGSELVMFGPSGSHQLSLNSETGFAYPLAQVALSYSRGYKTPEGFLSDSKEERWDLKIRKTF